MMKTQTKTDTDNSYIMVFKHNDDTCSLPPPPPKVQHLKKKLVLLIKLFRLYSGL